MNNNKRAIARRSLLKSASVAFGASALGTIPMPWLAQQVFAATDSGVGSTARTPRKKVLVTIFQRFGMDGLSLQSIFDVSVPFGKDVVKEKCNGGYTLAHILALYCILL